MEEGERKDRAERSGESDPPAEAARVEEVAAAPERARIERIERDEAGRLVVHLAGREEPLVDVKVARCFPWSLPGHYVSILDKEGKEIALFDTLDELEGENRAIVEEELAAKVFNPIIRRVVGHKHEFGVTSITAETDRGRVTFQVRSRDDVRTLSATRALFRDADGNIYELPDLTKLDRASRKHLDRYF